MLRRELSVLLPWPAEIGKHKFGEGETPLQMKEEPN